MNPIQNFLGSIQQDVKPIGQFVNSIFQGRPQDTSADPSISDPTANDLGYQALKSMTPGMLASVQNSKPAVLGDTTNVQTPPVQTQPSAPIVSGTPSQSTLWDASEYKTPTAKDDVPVPPANVQNLISTYFKGDEPRAAAVQYFENRGRDPNLISPTNQDGSQDYGLWQINSNTFKDYLNSPAYAPYLKARGINSLSDLLDPVKNTQVAYLKNQENRSEGVSPWNGWYGARDNGYNVYQ